MAQLDALIPRTHIAYFSPFQIVMAGKAHPRDGEGKRLIERLHAHIRDLSETVPAVFVPNYDLALARNLVSGGRHLAEHPAAAARGFGYQRDEGGSQRRPQLQRLGRLVARGLDRGPHRLGDRRWSVRRS